MMLCELNDSSGKFIKHNFDNCFLTENVSKLVRNETMYFSKTWNNVFKIIMNKWIIKVLH